jgi:hypothetical protein
MANEPKGSWAQVIIYFTIAAVTIYCFVAILTQKPHRHGYYYWPSAGVCVLLVGSAVALAIMKRRR